MRVCEALGSPVTCMVGAFLGGRMMKTRRGAADAWAAKHVALRRRSNVASFQQTEYDMQNATTNNNHLLSKVHKRYKD